MKKSFDKIAFSPKITALHGECLFFHCNILTEILKSWAEVSTAVQVHLVPLTFLHLFKSEVFCQLVFNVVVLGSILINLPTEVKMLFVFLF